jgi:hypothetical protein
MKDLPETIVDEILRRPREQVDETYENEPVLSRIFGLIKSVKITYTGGKPQKFVVWDKEGLRKTLSV